MLAIGLMSGTSLDGVDASLVDIENYYLDTKLKHIDSITLKMPENIKNKVKMASINKLNTEEICKLNFDLAYLFVKAIKKLIKKTKIDINDVDFISSHGQTIYHISGNSSLQIGEAAVLAYEFNKKVVSNFRMMDIAAGGIGAPLVPYVDYILYSSKVKNIALQNIGGISNITYIKKNSKLEEIVAFDNGVGNMLIDEAMLRLYSKSYDKNGEISKKGKLIKKMFEELCSHEYLNKKPPKSTGREEFGENYFNYLFNKYKEYKKEDFINTLTKFTAFCISDSIKKFIGEENLDELILSGGGANNEELIKYIKENLKTTKVLTQDEIGYSNDYKEAIAFVVLANETLNNHYSNVKSVTKAKKNVILGNITPKPY